METDPWYAAFEKLIAERGQLAKAGDYSWMSPQESVDPGAEESDIAHRHLDKIVNEYMRLRSKLSKGETGNKMKH
jgi:hypothetical protein